jgi:CubicO group peptidase (beta-lactamase class C family)
MQTWILVFGFCAAPLFGQLPAAAQAAIDETAAKILAQTGVPSASIAVVAGGKIAYVRTYGDARLDPKFQRGPRCVIKSLPTASRLRLRLSCCWPSKTRFRSTIR